MNQDEIPDANPNQTPTPPLVPAPPVVPATSTPPLQPTPTPPLSPTSLGPEPVLDIPQIERPHKSHFGRRIVYVLIILALIAGSVAAYFWFRDQATKSRSVKVGVLMAFTGGSSSMGYGASKGIQLAKKQLGADTIELVQADSKCDPNDARTAAQRLIDQGVVAIIGDGCSSASVAVLPMANNSKTVMVSPSASSTALSIPNDYFFRVIPPDTYQGEFMAQAIRDKGVDNVAIMYTNEPYGANMSRVFQEKFENLGGKVVATAYSEPDVIDLTAQMQKIKDAKPQAIFFAPNSVVTATAAINIGHDMGITAPLFGADIMYDKTIISNAPKAAEGLSVSTFPTGTSIFKQMLLSEYNVNEQLYAAPQAYDAFEAIYRAVKGGARTGEEIKDALPNISFDGMSAHISFDQNGEEPGKDYVYDLFQVKQGAFSEIEQ
jgi:branched-chain amino acid transport system substrate-binding protein